MKIGILGSVNTQESIWLEEEAKKQGHDAVRFGFYECIFHVGPNGFEVSAPFDLNSLDAVIVRGFESNYQLKGINFNKSTEGKLLLTYLHDTLNKVIVDEVLLTGASIGSKIATAYTLSKYKLPTPETYQFHTVDNLKAHLDKISFPVIAKHPSGSKGNNIFMLNNNEELEKFLLDAPKEMPFLFQQYLPNDGDLRVLVVGFKAIGAMKRFKAENDFRSNISQGAKAEKVILTEEIVKLAEAAAKATKVEIAGVDLIQSNGKYYVIEINRTPQFKGFTEYTGTNPSSFIIDYLEQKYNDSRA